MSAMQDGLFCLLLLLIVQCWLRFPWGGRPWEVLTSLDGQNCRRVLGWLRANETRATPPGTLFRLGVGGAVNGIGTVLTADDWERCWLIRKGKISRKNGEICAG